MSGLVGVALISMLIAAITTVAVTVVLDRITRTDMRIAPSVSAPLVAQIDGAVATPGLYELPPEARLADLISAAGGLQPDAEVRSLNLAARVGDGEAVTIPRPNEQTAASGTPVPSAPASGKLNLNTASLADLQTLPGIGPVIGQRIIDEREQHGPFGSVEELARVEGISSNLVETLAPLTTTDD
jgi:competence protein ComEA